MSPLVNRFFGARAYIDTAEALPSRLEIMFADLFI